MDESGTKGENQNILGNLAISKWVLGRRVDAFGTCPSPCAENQEVVPKPVLKRGHDSERPAHRDEEWPPPAATRESPRTETKTQHSQK